MIGREIALSLDIMLGTFQESDRTTAPEYVQKLQSRLGSCFGDVRAQLKKYRENGASNITFTSMVQSTSLEIAYPREKNRWEQVCPKLVPRWRGPLMVVKKFGML